jgi:hypothetical protein
MHYAGYYGIPRPLWILFMILGFMFWWPVGLAILFFSLWSGQMGCHSERWHERWQGKMARMQDKMDRMRTHVEGRHDWWGGAPRSSGNRAFDDYKAETLRRLEDEQREFHDFLRMSKDKTEFDQFMAERRNRPPASDQPPPSPPPYPQA